MWQQAFPQCNPARTFSPDACLFASWGLEGGLIGRSHRHVLPACLQRFRRQSYSYRAVQSAAAATPDTPEAQDRVTASVARDAGGLAKILSVLEVGSLAVAIVLQIQLLRREQAKLQGTFPLAIDPHLASQDIPTHLQSSLR